MAPRAAELQNCIQTPVGMLDFQSPHMRVGALLRRPSPGGLHGVRPYALMPPWLRSIYPATLSGSANVRPAKALASLSGSNRRVPASGFILSGAMNAPAKEELPSRRASDRIDGFFTRRTDTAGRLIPPDRGAYRPKPSPISTRRRLSFCVEYPRRFGLAMSASAPDSDRRPDIAGGPKGADTVEKVF
jgi:hypothetical protein